MPVMDGLTATKKIRTLNHPDAKKNPIIAMTANALKEDKEKVPDSRSCHRDRDVGLFIVPGGFFPLFVP